MGGSERNEWLRAGAVVLAVLAVGFPVAMAFRGLWSIPTDQGCMSGLGAILPIVLTVVVSGPLALLGSVLGFASYRRLAPPRPRARTIELGLIVVPAVAVLALLVAFVASFY